jgi:hypothetical protein
MHQDNPRKLEINGLIQGDYDFSLILGMIPAVITLTMRVHDVVDCSCSMSFLLNRYWSNWQTV